MEAQVYVSGALTNIQEETKLFYEKIGALFTKNGRFAYIPHKKSDPIEFASLDPGAVYQMDSMAILNSKLIVVYLGQPSTGVGIEMEIAKSRDIPMVLLYEQTKTVSRMALGMPNIKKIIKFTNFDDALEQLEQGLQQRLF
ncbi:MAG: XRE family transcriptional regulator [Parcubacteria group bacterium Gr01-1014_18]|nr:MAG: XRE family transcriptional regulator [Parcubacteria group bacterium Greene0416_36]TSC81196.1 MAG: XRE family transcriptional regulator [Parcubacteria group bacterium Gr01-1014_18]TSC99193.1 MAG: XRE family transcriptional regulator [Parcubacteria group bacterium Greene1014_20]TSD07449.1 MAG: XRE family transcriptional regulator [Parcubacteria group bacterium Greene0714_2]